MRWVKKASTRVQMTEQMIRSILCEKLNGARGRIYTIKVGHLCKELFGEDVNQSCRVAMRRYVLGALYEAIVHELTNKYRIVVQVGKAKELLACGGHEN